MSHTTVKSQEAASLPLSHDDLIIGEPIPWSVYDEYQHLLLRKGFVISSQRQLDTLFARGIRRLATEPAQELRESFGANNKFHVFELKEILIERLGAAFKMFESTEQQFFPFIIGKLALDIQTICLDNPDSILAALQLDIDGDYKLNQPVHAAVLCEILAKRLGVSQMHRLSLVAAALCHDICAYAEQADLDDTFGPLNASQWAHVKGHPQRAYKALLKAGVTDDVWLNCVLHHHERNDGSGYPYGLVREQMHLTTRILNVCDVFTAMIRKRPYRNALKAKYAIKELMLCTPEFLDVDIGKIFVDEVGIYHPGCIVRLKTGQVAVVTARGTIADEPELLAITDGSSAYLKPKKVLAKEVGILGVMPVKVLDGMSIDIANLWPLMQPISIS
jgi:HD-GYP domain-containing protein (c-di-GMP phosphodiesterase class II)